MPSVWVSRVRAMQCVSVQQRGICDFKVMTQSHSPVELLFAGGLRSWKQKPCPGSKNTTRKWEILSPFFLANCIHVSGWGFCPPLKKQCANISEEKTAMFRYFKNVSEPELLCFCVKEQRRKGSAACFLLTKTIVLSSQLKTQWAFFDTQWAYKSVFGRSAQAGRAVHVSHPAIVVDNFLTHPQHYRVASTLINTLVSRKIAFWAQDHRICGSGSNLLKKSTKIILSPVLCCVCHQPCRVYFIPLFQIYVITNYTKWAPDLCDGHLFCYTNDSVLWENVKNVSKTRQISWQFFVQRRFWSSCCCTSFLNVLWYVIVSVCVSVVVSFVQEATLGCSFYEMRVFVSDGSVPFHPTLRRSRISLRGPGPQEKRECLTALCGALLHP